MAHITSMMARSLASFIPLLLAHHLPLAGAKPLTCGAARTCATIEKGITFASAVTYPGLLNPLTLPESAEHWFKSSNQIPTCIVEVGTVEDISVVLKAIGTDRVPFAIMAGGHASNPGFSSTKGVHISLKRLNQLTLSPDHSTVEIGFGQTWLDVFEKLEPTGFNVVGGRTPGPGVGGFTLGGGFSWKTNQHGLTVDTVREYNLVLPNGTTAVASQDANQDLFWALKGGMNRFGIVTSAVLETHPQPSQVYGGFIIYPSTSVPAVLNLTTDFFYNSIDRRTQIITTMNSSPQGSTGIVLLVHDGPERPAVFEAFEQVPYLFNTVKAQSFVDMVKGFPSEDASIQNIRGAFATISTSELSPRFVEAINQECATMGKIMALHGGESASYDIEPFTKYGEFATDSAYPHDYSPLPLNLYFAWANATEDAYWYGQMRESLERLKQVAIEDGIYGDHFTQYPNYALANTTSEELYGSQHAARLSRIRDIIDPDRVMDLAGGFAI